MPDDDQIIASGVGFDSSEEKIETPKSEHHIVDGGRNQGDQDSVNDIQVAEQR